MPILLDTHAWMWWVSGDKRLSKRARAAISKAQSEEDLWLSLISVWEVAKKIEKRLLVLDRELEQWLDLATTMPGLHLWELSRAIVVESCQLPQPFHGDSADQMIVASARHHGATLITKDRKIRDYAQVRTLW
jgi:PIN domain nuclease of toxin-antitoxin system